MYDRKKLTIKGRFSDVCFRQKMLSRPKDRSFTPPENLPGEGLKHTFIREKRRFSAFGQNASWAQIYPRNEKTDQKTGRRRILKMVGIARFEFSVFNSFFSLVSIAGSVIVARIKRRIYEPPLDLRNGTLSFFLSFLE